MMLRMPITLITISFGSLVREAALPLPVPVSVPITMPVPFSVSVLSSPSVLVIYSFNFGEDEEFDEEEEEEDEEDIFTYSGQYEDGEISGRGIEYSVHMFYEV
tara:strand:+ start:1252 stop:1560 length:309 start_codon:yes stop_codon:yes gene_type:complete